MAQDYPTNVKRWDVFEVQLQGPEEGNPFLDHTLTGIFTGRNESVTVKGFYDGSGTYKIRFMPSFTGKYNFILQASFIKGSLSGTFFVKDNDENNHGIVRLHDTYHFMYEDGTVCHPFSSNAYTWYLQDEETMHNTVASLQNAGIKRLRFEAMPDTENMFVNADYDSYNISHLHKLEQAVTKLAEAGIEADLIVSGKTVNELSLTQKVNYFNMMCDRFSAYHNVWWTLSRDPAVTDLYKMADTISKRDSYRHLRSVSGVEGNFDFASNWTTHCSIEASDLYNPVERTNAIREWYKKPVIMDDIGLEGDQPDFRYALPAKEIVRRSYETVIRGGYPSLSEAYGEDLFVEKGGTWKGEATERISFLTKILDEVPGQELSFVDNPCHIAEGYGSDGKDSQYLYYFGYLQCKKYTFHEDDDKEYAVDIIDTWNMDVQHAGVFQSEFAIELPDVPYLLIRLRKPEESDYHPVEKEEEAAVSEETEVLPADEIIEEDDTAEDSDYMEAEVISDKNELAQPHEDMNESDTDVMHEEVMHVSEEPSEPFSEDPIIEEDDDISSDEDELPDIISVPSDDDALDNTAELRKMPLEGEAVPEMEKSHTLNILTRRSRRQK